MIRAADRSDARALQEIYNQGIAERQATFETRERALVEIEAWFDVGRRLLDALCATAERRGYYKVSSRVFACNAASRALHRAAGFREVGVQQRHGRLDGVWHDVVLVERLIGEAAAEKTGREAA